MMSSWIIPMGPKSNGRYPYKETHRGETQKSGKGHVKTRTETGIRPLPNKQQRLPANHQELPRGTEGFHYRSQREGSCRHFDFGLLAPKTLRQLLVVLSHPVHGTLWQKPQKTNEGTLYIVFLFLGILLLGFCCVFKQRAGWKVSDTPEFES